MDVRAKKGLDGLVGPVTIQIVGGRQAAFLVARVSPGLQSKQGEAVEGCSVAPKGQGQGSFHRSETDRKEVGRRPAEEPRESQTDPDQDPRHAC
jgi:hypothetical protein